MRICFILPQVLRKPIGGYKIVYEYSNRLSLRGYDMCILFINDKALKRFRLPKMLQKLLINILTQIEPRWFKFYRGVKKYSTTEKAVKEKISNADIAIATGVNTFSALYEYFPKAKKLYFVQGYETWVTEEHELIKTYEADLKKIVVSNWLKRIVDKYSKEPSWLISNPIDIKEYKPLVPVEGRDRYCVGLLFHEDKNKGFEYAFEAVKKAKQQIPELYVLMFGTSKTDFSDYNWINYSLNATKEETIKIYNKISIFVCASIKEGFGLTGLEAMACGAALVSTDYDGAREYAISDYNSVLSPIKDAEFLARNIVDLIRDDERRIQIAKYGVISSKRMSWDYALDKMEELIKSV